MILSGFFSRRRQRFIDTRIQLGAGSVGPAQKSGSARPRDPKLSGLGVGEDFVHAGISLYAQCLGDLVVGVFQVLLVDHLGGIHMRIDQAQR